MKFSTLFDGFPYWHFLCVVDLQLGELRLRGGLHKTGVVLFIGSISTVALVVVRLHNMDDVSRSLSDVAATFHDNLIWICVTLC